MKRLLTTLVVPGCLVATMVVVTPPPPAYAATTGTCTESSGPDTVTVTCTPGRGSWTPPAWLSSATFELDGAAGGSYLDSGGPSGGAGGHTIATMAVSSSTTYHVAVGFKGGDGSPSNFGSGGFPGGGSGGRGGCFPDPCPAGSGGGGGASIVATGEVHSDTWSNWLLVAGGGGGAGGPAGDQLGSAGGDGGGTMGETGGPVECDPFTGECTAQGGEGGDQTGESGSGLHGIGSGGCGCTDGGGGGGFYGGGRGPFGSSDGDGGGGGSGFVVAGVTGTTTVGAGSIGDGLITITYAARTLTVAIQGDGSGTVTSSPAGIDCGSDCAAAYADGTVVTLAATADVGAVFVSWTGACTGSATCVVTMDKSQSVTATFAIEYTLIGTTTGLGPIPSRAGGVLQSAPAGLSCERKGGTDSLGDCTGTFASGTTITLSAVPNAHSTASISGACTAPEGRRGEVVSCQVTIDAAKSVTATFRAWLGNRQRP